MLADVRGWFFALPPITRLWIAALLLLRLAVLTGLVTAHSLAFSPDLIVRDKEYWRVATGVLFHGPLLGARLNVLALAPFLIDLVFLISAGADVEASFASSRSYALTLALGACCLEALAVVAPTPFLAASLVMLALALWAHIVPDGEVHLFFFRLPARYVPWIYVALRLVLGGFPLGAVAAIVLAHVLAAVWIGRG